MSSVQRTTVSRLAPAERAELESLLAAHRAGGDKRFLSDLQDAAAWWILVLVAATCGVVAAVYELSYDIQYAADIGWWTWLRSSRLVQGLVALLAIIAWTAFTWIRNHGRRGFAATSFATIRVKGPSLALLRHADVAKVEIQRVRRGPGYSFSVLILTGTDGRRWQLLVHGAWIEAVLKEMRQAREAAGLVKPEGWLADWGWG